MAEEVKYSAVDKMNAKTILEMTEAERKAFLFAAGLTPAEYYDFIKHLQDVLK